MRARAFRMKRSSSGSGCDSGHLVTPGAARPPIHPGLHRPRLASVPRLGGAPPRCGSGEAGGVSTVGTGPGGVERRIHSRRYRRGLGGEARIVLAVVARSFGATFGLGDLREPEANRNGRPTVEFELWEFPFRLMTARHRTGWGRLQDAARHPHMARLLKEFGKL